MAGGVADAVRRFLAARTFGSESGIVAVSGGADSVALLRALALVRTGPLAVAHFNHHLRGAESDGDAAFVCRLAEQYTLPVRVGDADVKAVATATGDNLEATARRLRYDWLARVAREVGAAWVATGHTADDQAETVLHRMIRGTGLQGLRGIAADKPIEVPAPVGGNRGAGGVRVVRPLLAVTRRDVIGFLESLGQPFREDTSNADARFTRNRIRADLIPLLKTFNPAIVSAFTRFAAQADEAHELVGSLARGLLDRAECPRAGEGVILDATAMTAAPALVVRAALRIVWEREGWPMDRMGFDAWERAVSVVAGGVDGWDFPGGISARRRGQVVRIGKGS